MDEGAEGAAPGSLPHHEWLLRYSSRLQAMLHNLSVHIFHSATPFVFFGPYYTALTQVPVVATCYDLIPLIFPRDYFATVEGRDSYYRMLRNLRAATYIAAISRSAASDFRLYTGYLADQIDLAYPFVEEVFRLSMVDTPCSADRPLQPHDVPRALPREEKRVIHGARHQARNKRNSLT